MTTADRIIATLRQPMTARELATATGINERTVWHALAQLERDDRVRKCGAQHRTATGRPADYWRTVDHSEIYEVAP